MATKRFTAGPLEFKADASGPQGAFRAIIATLNEIDKDGDVTVPGAFPAGAAVKIAAWGHNWGDLPVGMGTIGADAQKAWVDGQFFLDTPQGEAHYRTVKNLGALQEWSYGFEVKQSDFGEFQGQSVRFLRGLDVFEASPVMIGAGNNTGTDFIKGAKSRRRTKPATAAVDAKQYVDLEEIAPEGSYEELAEDLEDAFEATQPQGAIVEAIATFPNRVIFSLIVPPNNSGLSYAPWPDPTYWDVPYVENADDTITLGAPVQVEISASFVPADTLGKSATRLALALKADANGGVKAGARNSASDAERLQQIHDLAVTNGASCDMPKALPLASHVTCLLGGARVLLDRLHAKASLRAGDGRRPGESYAQALRDLDGMLSEVKTALQAHDAPTPNSNDGQALYAQFLAAEFDRMLARHAGRAS